MRSHKKAYSLDLCLHCCYSESIFDARQLVSKILVIALKLGIICEGHPLTLCYSMVSSVSFHTSKYNFCVIKL